MKEMKVLELKNVSVNYGKEKIIRNVSFTVDQGEIVGIVGESGSGKSTLLRSIIDLPGASLNAVGSILFKGKDINDISKKERQKMRGRDIGMIFQKPDAAMDPIVLIGEQFYEAVKVHNNKAKRKEVRWQSKKILELLGFSDCDKILDSYPFEMSGGMNQRIALAMSMLNQPQIILADEPTSALDVTVQSQVVGIMKELREKFGMSILMVTHNMNVMKHMADKIGVMYGGRIVEFGTRDEIFNVPKHPYTKALLASIPTMEANRLTGIPGNPPSFSDIGEGCSFYNRCLVACQGCKEEVPVTRCSETHWYICYGEEGERANDFRSK